MDNMNFYTILTYLKLGKNVKRKCWKNEYIFLDSEYFFVCDGFYTDEYSLRVDDLEATDWILEED